MSIQDIQDHLRANRLRYERKIADIRQDPDLTLEAKARRIAPYHKEAIAEEKRLRAERMAGLRRKVRSAEREAFAAPALRDADPAAAEANYRAALDSVEGITDPEILSRRLERASITGDRTLARAVAWRANELQHDGVVRAYLDSDEDANRKWTKWAQAHGEVERVERLGETLGFGEAPIQEPPELRGHVREAS